MDKFILCDWSLPRSHSVRNNGTVSYCSHTSILWANLRVRLRDLGVWQLCMTSTTPVRTVRNPNHRTQPHKTQSTIEAMTAKQAILDKTITIIVVSVMGVFFGGHLLALCVHVVSEMIARRRNPANAVARAEAGIPSSIRRAREKGSADLSGRPSYTRMNSFNIVGLGDQHHPASDADWSSVCGTQPREVSLPDRLPGRNSLKRMFASESSEYGVPQHLVDEDGNQFEITALDGDLGRGKIVPVAPETFV